MLVTFSSDAYENITMFGDVAKRLLTLMGHSATIPGALLAKDIPDALSRLEAGINQEPKTVKAKNEDDDEPEISLSHRALPLINMLKAASKKNVNLMWK